MPDRIRFRKDRELMVKAREILSTMDKEDMIEVMLSLLERDSEDLRSFVSSHCPSDDRALLYELARADIKASFSDVLVDPADWCDGYCPDDGDEELFIKDAYVIMDEVLQRTEKHAAAFRNKGMFLEAFSIVYDAFLMICDDEDIENPQVRDFAPMAGALWNEIFAVSHRDDYEAYGKLFSLYMEKNREIRSSLPLLSGALSDAAAEGFSEAGQLEAMLSDTVSFIHETPSYERSELERLSSLFIRLSEKLRKGRPFMLSVLEALPDGIRKAEEERVELYEEEGRWNDALCLISSKLENDNNLDWDERCRLMRKEVSLVRKAGDLPSYEEKIRILVRGQGYDEETIKEFLASGVENAREKMLSFIEHSDSRMDILRIMDESSLMFSILENENEEYSFPLYSYPPLLRHLNHLKDVDPERTLDLYASLLDKLEPSANTKTYRREMAGLMKRLYDSFGAEGRAECLRLISIWKERHGRRTLFFSALHDAGVDR